MKGDPLGGALLLDDPRYLRFLADAHPHLEISEARLEVPSFIAPLDVREPLLPGVTRALLQVGAHLSPAHVTPPSLFLGTPFERYEQTHLVDNTADPEGLTGRARRFAEERGLELVVITCVSPHAEQLTAFIDAGFVALPSFPDTLVPLATADLDAHLLSLPPGDRSGIRRNIRRFERAGHRLERLSTSRRDAAALYEAYLPMFERATVKWYPHTPAYFEGVAELDERVRLTVARTRDGALCGFVINFDDGDAFHAGRIGVSPGYYKKDAVYFRLLYHVLEESLALGARRLVLEPTGYRMKRHLGARRRRLVNLVLGVSPSWRLLLSTMAGVGRRALSHLDRRRVLEGRY